MIHKVLKYAGVASTTWYDHQRAKGQDRRRLNKGRRAPGMLAHSGGYKKLKHYLLRWQGIKINHKKLYRLCQANGLLLRKRGKRRFKGKLCVNRRVCAPHQLWEFDIKYGYIHGEGRPFFLLAYIDVFSRKIVDYHVGLHCKGYNLVATLAFALKKASITKTHTLAIRSDNGSQMRCNQLRDYLASLAPNITHEFIPAAMPNKNAHIESFFSILERECLALNYFNNIKEVCAKLDEFIDFYNKTRIHSSLGYRAPEDIIKAYHQNQPLGKVIKTAV